MSYKINAFSLFLSLFLLFSCSENMKQFEEFKNHDIDLTASLDDTPAYSCVTRIGDEFEDFELIPLENSDMAILGEIIKMQACDSGLYIQDSQDDNSLFYFNLNGDFVSKIGAKGHSKTEYTDIVNFCANSVGDTVAIMDYNYVKFYDNNGVFLRAEPLKGTYQWQGFLYTDNGFFLSTSNRGLETVLIQYTNNFKIDTCIIESPTVNVIRDIPSSCQNLIQINGNKICYYDYYTSTLFVINIADMKDSKRYTFHSPNILTEDKMRSGKFDSFDLDHLESFVFEDSVVWGRFKYCEDVYDFRLDVKTDSCILNRHVDFGYYFQCSYKGWYYLAIEPSMLLHILDSENCGQNSTRKLLENALKPFAGKISDSDNYYILRMRKKKDNNIQSVK